MTSTALTEIPFHNQTILAQQQADGEVFVPLKPVCENLGIAYNGQYERLQRQKWATIRMTRTVGADGKNRDMTAIDRRTFSMWLATIDTARIKNEDAKNLIVAYQCEAADVLDAYFFGNTRQHAADEKMMRMLTEANAALIATNEALRATVHTLIDAGKTVAKSRKTKTAHARDADTYTTTERWYLRQIKKHGYAIPGDCPFPDPMAAHKAMVQRFGLRSATKRVHVADQRRKIVRRILLPTSLTPTV